ncbi:MAG: hypothetical protein AAGI91_16000 [Bacteroidota bacterium]
MSRHAGHLLGLAALALAMAWLYGEIDHLGAFADVDLKHYRALAQGAADVPRPFAHRVLGPLFVGLLPVADPAGFRVLTSAALAALTLGLYGFGVQLGLTAWAAALVAALLTLNPYVFGFPAFNAFQLNDVLGMALVVAAFAALPGRRWGWYALALALGAATREVTLLVIPAALVFLWGRDRLRDDGLRWLLASLPAVAVFVGLRLALPAEGPGFAFLLLDHIGKVLDPVTWYRLLVNAWAPLALLPLVFWQTARDFAAAHRYLFAFAALVLLSALFGGDQERLVAPAFVAVYPLVGYVVQTHRWPRLALGVLVACAFLTSLHHLTARFPLPSRTWTVALSLFALAAVTATGWLVKRGRAEGRKDGSL